MRGDDIGRPLREQSETIRAQLKRRGPGNRKLTEDDVREIRNELAEDSRQGRKLALAERKGVSLGCIENIWQGRTWTHVREG